jgi:hypothetical protein
MTHLGQQPLRFVEAYHQIVSEGGHKRLYKGAGPTLCRGYLMSMVTLPMFDAVMNKLEA